MRAGNPEAVAAKDLVLSGGFGRSTNSARAGFLPVGLEHVPMGALQGIPVYIRVKPGQEALAATPDASSPEFRLYCAENVRFSEMHRRRLVDHKVTVVYIRMADQARFKHQTEDSLTEIAKDPASAVSEKSQIIYDTSVELINELLAEPELMAKSPRLEQVSRAITTLVMNNANAFTHLFTASHHDFYTATHMVNVATWMVPLAYAMGYTDSEELNRICLAGILHDMGKVAIPESILNKKGKLTDEEWTLIRKHPEDGVKYLERFGGIHPLIMTVTLQHHERLDGTGYPKGLKGEDIHPISRICAVVDSFDAMTAFRPFKDRTLSVTQAMNILLKETPAKYDAKVMDAWASLIVPAVDALPTQPPAQAGSPPQPASSAANRREHDRRTFHCHGRAHQLTRQGPNIAESKGVPIVAHSISRGGVGFLSHAPLPAGTFLRVYLEAPGWDNRALDGQIVRCRAHNDNWHEVGLQFVKIEADDLRLAA